MVKKTEVTINFVSNEGIKTTKKFERNKNLSAQNKKILEKELEIKYKRDLSKLFKPGYNFFIKKPITNDFKIIPIKKDLKDKSNFFLLYGENEGQKEEVINEYFLKEFKGETIKFEEKEILENKEIFFDACLNDSLFASEKIIHISRITSKIYEIIKDTTSRKLLIKKLFLIVA